MNTKASLSHDRLREILDYDPETGVFRRKVRKSDLRKDETVTQERLREVLEYDPLTGLFIWTVKTARKTVVGSEAGVAKVVSSGIYRYIAIDGVRYLAHRLAWFWVRGEWPRLLKFKDGDSLNCAFDNLEDAGASLGTNKTGEGYVYIRVDDQEYPAARLAWFYVHGEWPGTLRFRDGNRENFRISNLRDSSAEPSYPISDQERSDLRKSRYEQERDRSRDLAFQAKYGIDLAEYRRMEREQDGKCAICGKPEIIERNGKPRLLAVDHCHDTTKVRGLLCGKCNPMIGYADHSIEILTSAIAYLRRTNGEH